MAQGDGIGMDSSDDVKDQVRDIANNLKDAYTFKKQRQAASDWWNKQVGKVKDFVSPDVSAGSDGLGTPKKVTAKTTTTISKPASLGNKRVGTTKAQTLKR